MKTIVVGFLVMTFFCMKGFVQAQDLVMVTGIAKHAENSPEATVKKKTFEFYTYSQDENLKKYNNQVIDEHFLGNNIAKKYTLFNDTYIVKTPISPGNPTMKISIRKPVVYTSVKKIEKQLKKSVNKNLISKESAVIIFNKVLDVAISIVNDSTEQFENEINSSDTTETLIDLYTHRVNLKYID